MIFGQFGPKTAQNFKNIEKVHIRKRVNFGLHAWAKFIAKSNVVTSEKGILLWAPPQRSIVLEPNFDPPPYFPCIIPSQILSNKTRAIRRSEWNTFCTEVVSTSTTAWSIICDRVRDCRAQDKTPRFDRIQSFLCCTPHFTLCEGLFYHIKHGAWGQGSCLPPKTA